MNEDHSWGALEARVSIMEHEVNRLREWRHEMPTALTIIQAQVADAKSEIMDVLLPLKATVETRLETHRDGRHTVVSMIAVVISGLSLIVAAVMLMHVIRP